MLETVKIFFTALPIFLVVDFIWLTLIAKSFYQKYIGYLMKTTPNITAAVIFYLIFIVGLTVFVIKPGLDKKSLIDCILLGSLFGLVTYATYDLTNLATIKDWPLIVTIIDLIWGSFISVLVSVLSFLIISKTRL